jgi:hypothetical protein
MGGPSWRFAQIKGIRVLTKRRCEAPRGSAGCALFSFSLRSLRSFAAIIFSLPFALFVPFCGYSRFVLEAALQVI